MAAFLDDLFSLAGRTAVITGGNSGIGRAMAEALGRAGAGIVLVARQRDRLRTACAELSDNGIGAAWLSADLGSRPAVRELADELVRLHGEPDILVNAAGVNLRPPMNELTEDEWDRTMALNLDAPFLLGQRFGSAMAAKGWGRIINIASQQTIRAFGNSGA